MINIGYFVVVSVLAAGSFSFAAKVPDSPDIAISKSGAHISYSAMKPNDFGSKRIEPDATGIRPMSPLPAPGVHPRMLHSPQDREPLRHLYYETEHGRLMWGMLHGWTDKLKGKLIDRNAFPTHPDGKMLAPYNRGGWEKPAEQYARILDGNLDGYKMSMNDPVIGSMALEAYRCWIENDVEAGQELALAMENIADYLEPTVKPGDHPGAIGAHNMGFCYDYAYNFMTDEQRDKIRKLIAIISLHKAHYGTFIEPDATTSNWCTLDSFLPLTLLAIEGEEGFNEEYYKGFVRAYRNFITYGWYQSGCPYEGLGKNYQFNSTMMLLSRRGLNLPSHPHVRAYATKFLPAVSLPNGKGFIGCDDWGGTGSNTVEGNYRFNVNDIIGLKWLFPNDPAVDYVWTMYFGQNYERYNDLRPTGYYNSALTAVMFPSAPNTPELDADAAGFSATFFCPERGYMTTRSDMSPDALFVSLHCRQDKGGHTSADRNTFVFAGLGRLWGYQMNIAGGSKFGKVNESRFFSTVLIDDVGQCGMASGCFPVPGKMIDFEDDKILTYACGDAKYAYDWEWNWGNGNPDQDSPMLEKGWEKVLETPNDFQFYPVDQPYMNKPFYEQHHWLQPGKVQHYVKRPWNPVEKAFRTTAMVRGANPYVLIIDDIKKDNKQHEYKWLMQAAQDLEIIGFGFSNDSDITDIYLAGNEAPRNSNGLLSPRKGDPVLLVRILECNNDMSKRRYTPIGRIEQYMSNIRWPKASGKRLVIPSYSVSPDFKIMLYPHRHGDELPETKWNHNKDQLDIVWENQSDTIRFQEDEAGRTHLQLERDA
ncbi:hypothetical protein [Rubellicoccus peritrichatus]|uniref:Heparinase II/III-like protein n=1 Tax=Rubellicoccus peritrichatus TaxID=3080537 RepID=A0AAQ3L8L5_9BACT|nr:hypothetical protein [Puniceicoccus sp. CR14]WOO39924.1 hypothetical protein RZN69_14960 [Puniceicoccus sp. CR14]